MCGQERERRTLSWSPSREDPVQLRSQTYDPKTCFTAKDLRKMGYAVPAHIPDEAWVPKTSVKSQPTGSVERLPGNKAAVYMRLTLSEPFRGSVQIGAEVKV